MIERIFASEFIRSASSGRTTPAILSCESDHAGIVEVFCKLSSGFEEGAIHLMREAVAACLAADLGLPVPKPYLVHLTPEFVAGVGDEDARTRMERSSSLSFASTRVPSQFSAWTEGHAIDNHMRQVAAAVFLFDGIIQNSDRRTINPNCLVRGSELRIFDHDLCFANKHLLGWRAPWLDGGLEHFRTAGAHIFFKGLKGTEIDYGPLQAAWSALSNQRLDEYVESVPAEWPDVEEDLQSAIDLIRQSRDRIDDCIAEMRRVLE